MSDDLPDIEEMPPALSDLMMWAGGTGFDTRGCTCGHETLGPTWHLSFCPWPGRAWEGYARRLAAALDSQALVDNDAQAFARHLVSDEEAQAFADRVNNYEGP